MFCRNCGNEVSEKAIMCVACGTPPKAGNKYCYNCKAETSAVSEICLKCGVGLNSSIGQDLLKTKQWVDTSLLVLTIIGIICVFLPWFYIKSSVSASGYGFNSSYSAESPSLIGILTWAGFPVLLLLITEIIFI